MYYLCVLIERYTFATYTPWYDINININSSLLPRQQPIYCLTLPK
jgi:hypothetical protein